MNSFTVRLVSLLSVWCAYATLFLSEGAGARPQKLRRQTTEESCPSIFQLGYDLYLAYDVYTCLTSVPFNSTIALEFLQYYKDTLELQTTQSYLKDPPADYQQPAFDLFGTLEQIKADVNAGTYKNEYDFETALQKFVFGTHDAHIILQYGISSVFTFGSPYSIVSLSTNGIDIPKIFIAGQ